MRYDDGDVTWHDIDDLIFGVFDHSKALVTGADSPGNELCGETIFVTWGDEGASPSSGVGPNVSRVGSAARVVDVVAFKCCVSLCV